MPVVLVSLSNTIVSGLELLIKYPIIEETTKRKRRAVVPLVAVLGSVKKIVDPADD